MAGQPSGPAARPVHASWIGRRTTLADDHLLRGFDLPRLDGRAAIVTGATGGLGFELARALVRLGADVTLAGRDPVKGQHALVRLSTERSAAPPRFGTLDLADLAAVRRFAASIGRCDILVNNAGLMGTPTRHLTTDGFERQFGTNYLGHFALTGLLLPLLARAGGGGRVVSVASLAHRRGTIDFDDLQAERGYRPFKAYAQSKLAMLVFALELDRRARARGWPVTSIACHPGWAATDIIRDEGGSAAHRAGLRVLRFAFGRLAQTAAAGAAPLLVASASPTAAGGTYWGPDGRGEIKGRPSLSRVMPQASDPATGARLWETSERLTGVTFATDAVPA